jgi:hypothetical protein
MGRLENQLASIDALWPGSLGPPRFRDFRRSDDVEDRRLQRYSQNPVVDPADQEVVGREQGTGFDYDYLSEVIRMWHGQSDPLSIAAGINDIEQ